MSQARIYFSTFAARKGAVIKCGSCGREIAKGEQYRWFKVGFRARFKNIRCIARVCDPKPSQLESSALADVYAAIEDASATLDSLAGGDPEEDSSSITDSMAQAADAIRDVASAYSEAAEAMGAAGEESQEKADTLESAADEIEGFDAEDRPTPDHDGEHDPDVEQDDCEECRSEIEDWWNNQIDEARGLLEGVELP